MNPNRSLTYITYYYIMLSLSIIGLVLCSKFQQYFTYNIFHIFTFATWRKMSSSFLSTDNRILHFSSLPSFLFNLLFVFLFVHIPAIKCNFIIFLTFMFVEVFKFNGWHQAGIGFFAIIPFACFPWKLNYQPKLPNYAPNTGFSILFLFFSVIFHSISL